VLGQSDPHGRVSFHEAGHALVAHLLSGEVIELTLEDDELPGRTSVRWSGLDPARLQVALACTALGGPVAELLLEGDDLLEDPTVVRAWQADWHEVEEVASEVESDPLARERWIQARIRQTHTLLADVDHREVLLRIGDALEAHGTLDQALFHECLQ